ncbi:arsinothricin resistance N-acetyltransferase ArsN1 family A [Lysobacter soli]|uniref:arsinothricin resistance N-acetyltransferase ArsN1 family A n=1 Tax=Lysobacter soli TaxID=453783 RepID=UPI0036A94035
MIRIRSAEMEDASAIAAIYNQGIAERSSTFETNPRSTADIEQRLADMARYPLLVASTEAGEVLGWAGLSGYRPRDCYAGIGEFSVYLDAAARGKGIGRQLLHALIDVARERGYWKLLSRIFLFNTASRALCQSAGFREVGIYEKHGQLEGRWLDVVIVERLIPENLSTPTTETEAATATA